MLAFTLLFAVLSSRIKIWQFLAYMKTVYLVILTFANPHVYLDTVVLIGSVSQQFLGNNKLAYVLGASLASFVFFFSLAYSAKFLSPIMQRPIAWRLLDSFIAFVMFTLAIKMAQAAGWF